MDGLFLLLKIISMRLFSLKSITIASLLLLLATSCSKEVPPQATFPDEITWETREAFLEAPKEVMEAVYAKYRAAHPIQRQVPDVAPPSTAEMFCLNRYIGFVTAWNGSAWVGMNGVSIINTGEPTIYTSSTPTQSGRYNACINSAESCVFYQVADELNGVDMIDAMKIYFHVQASVGDADASNLFENMAISPEDAARMYVAADVNNSGFITILDALQVSYLVDGIDFIFGYFEQDLAFVPATQLTLASVADQTAFRRLNDYCYPTSNSSAWFRRCIKKGDIDGTFSF